MEHYLIIARSVTYAQRMQKTLDRGGIHSRIFRAPRELTDLGCAYAVQIHQCFSFIMSIFFYGSSFLILHL